MEETRAFRWTTEGYMKVLLVDFGEIKRLVDSFSPSAPVEDQRGLFADLAKYANAMTENAERAWQLTNTSVEQP